MSLMSLEQLTPLALVAQYICEVRGSSHFLTRDEMELVDQWLRLAHGKSEDVIVILDEVLVKKIQDKAQTSGKKVSMKSLHKTVTGRLEQRNALKGS